MNKSEFLKLFLLSGEIFPVFRCSIDSIRFCVDLWPEFPKENIIDELYCAPVVCGYPKRIIDFFKEQNVHPG
jgi:hypothetical protein